MTYRVRYEVESETWIVEHWAWLDHGYSGGPWLPVSRQPSETAAWRYINDVTRRQHDLVFPTSHLVDDAA